MAAKCSLELPRRPPGAAWDTTGHHPGDPWVTTGDHQGVREPPSPYVWTCWSHFGVYFDRNLQLFLTLVGLFGKGLWCKYDPIFKHVGPYFFNCSDKRDHLRCFWVGKHHANTGERITATITSKLRGLWKWCKYQIQNVIAWFPHAARESHPKLVANLVPRVIQVWKICPRDLYQRLYKIEECCAHLLGSILVSLPSWVVDGSDEFWKALNEF